MPVDPELLESLKQDGVDPDLIDSLASDLGASNQPGQIESAITGALKSLADPGALLGPADPRLHRSAVRGFLGQQEQQNSTVLERGFNFVGDQGPVIAAGTIGEAGGPLVSGLAAGGARAIQLGSRQGYRALVGQEGPSIKQDISDVGKTIAVNAAVPAVIKGAGSFAAKSGLGQYARGGLETVLQAFPRFKPSSARAIANDAGLLSRAPTIEAAGEAFENFVKGTGLKNGTDGAKAVTGDFVLNASKKLELYNSALDDLAKGSLDPQKALVAREQTAKMLQQSKWNNAEFAVEKRELSIGLEKLDDFLEQKIPGYENVRKMYREAKIGQEASNILPRNKNNTPDALRTLLTTGGGGIGAGLGALLTGNPLVLGAAALGTAAVSPAVYGGAIRAGYRAGQAFGAVGAPATRLGLQQYYRSPSTTQ